MTDVKGAYFDLNGKMLNKPQKGLCAQGDSRVHFFYL